MDKGRRDALKGTKQDLLKHSVRVCPGGAHERVHEPYRPVYIPRSPESNGIVRFKQSDKWTGVARIRNRGYKLNLVNKGGYVSENLLGLWHTTPSKLFATQLATSYRRLKSRAWKWNGQKLKGCLKRHTLLQMALVGLLVGDAALRRCCEIGKRSRENLHKHIYWLVNNKMDEPSKVIYGQAVNSASWFQHRGKPRDESIKTSRFFGLRQPRTCEVPKVKELIKNAIEGWARKYLAPPSVPRSERDALCFNTRHFSIFEGKRRDYTTRISP